MTERDGDNLFREEMGDVAPLKAKSVVVAKKSREPTAGQLRRRYDAETVRGVAGQESVMTLGEVISVEPNAELAWRQDGVQLGVFNKLKGGSYPIEGHLDLHHKTVAEARVAVWNFLNLALEQGWRCVVIAHGRGERSATPARLKSFVACWLEELTIVIALHSAQPKHGGVGATYVLVRKSKRAREQTREEHGGRA